MNPLRKYGHWLVLLFFLTLAGVFFNYLHVNFEKKENEARTLKLEYQQNRSIDQFTSSIDKFAGLVSGMRSYINLSPELPTAVEFQKFVQQQYSDLNLKDSIVVSFIDTSHVFKQSFTRYHMDPIHLEGHSVGEFRSEEKIRKLDDLMTSESLRLFPPLNLAEGWVGLPINFRVHRNGTTLGYVAAVISFKSIIEHLYADTMSDKFVFHFSTEEGYDFDRERTYNNTEIYTTREDSEYYKNFDYDPSAFLYSTKTYYGFDITIGTAYKNAYKSNKNFSYLLLFWYLTVSFLAILITWQVHQFKKLNLKLRHINTLLLENKNEIGQKNKQLQKLNNTQSKFFSIIGHDIKQPLSAIEGLLSLLEHEEINDPELADIIKSLGISTKNTTNLLNNLLRWARSQTGDIKYVPKALNLNTVLKEAVDTLFYQAKEKKIKVIYEPEIELPYRGDRDMLSTIFRNLISNAVKFSNLGGTVTIEARKQEHAVEISVTDSGIGMTPEAVNSLFKIDTQISGVGTSGEMGTGLGLILCDLFTKQHGGHIEVESELDRGSQFKVVLPV